MKQKFMDRLAELRKSLSYHEFSKVSGIPAESLRRWENGASEPKSGSIANLCQRFSVSADWLLGLSDSMAPALPATAETPTPYATAPPPRPPICPECLRMRSDLDRMEGRMESLQTQNRELLDRLARPTLPGIPATTPAHPHRSKP